MAMAAEARRAQFEELVRARVLRTLIRARIFGVGMVALLASALAVLDPDPVRIGLFCVGIGVIGAISVFELRRIDHPPTAGRLLVNVMVMAIGQFFVVVGAGGIASPLVPVQALFAAMIAIVAPRSLSAPSIAIVALPAIWVLAWLQSTGALVPSLRHTLFDGLYVGAGHGGIGPWIAAGIYTVMLFAGLGLGRFVRATIDDLVEQQVEDRERALEMHAEQNRTATALTAEIAHELKNPLASIKGLAALVQKDVSGQLAERVAVMRREVDRMQSTLDEFLAYSRPLVPIEAREVDLAELCREVVEMHEGVAQERGASVVVTGEVSGVRCDPRKLRAVIVNLVQNALDASRPGGEVRLELAQRDDGVELRVLDRGSGIDPNVAARLFEVGATTKPRGNGIGLPLSRGLVRQHGGELVLERREGGGAAAIVTLPSAPPETPFEGAAA